MLCCTMLYSINLFYYHYNVDHKRKLASCTYFCGYGNKYDYNGADGHRGQEQLRQTDSNRKLTCVCVVCQTLSGVWRPDMVKA